MTYNADDFYFDPDADLTLQIVGSRRIKCTNLSHFPGKALIKKIYAYAYKVYATEIIITKAKYNDYAVVTLYEDDDCICENYCIDL